MYNLVYRLLDGDISSHHCHYLSTLYSKSSGYKEAGARVVRCMSLILLRDTGKSTPHDPFLKVGVPFPYIVVCSNNPKILENTPLFSQIGPKKFNIFIDTQIFF
jgi:hypothetical protein